MIYTIFGFDYVFNIETYQMLLLAASLGLYLRLLLSLITHQYWLRNYSQYLVFSLLPITGYLITSVISTNIALSLGMVGALSIVRFRTPVKNPSELAIYFCLITIGIVVNVNPNIAVNFMVFVTFIIAATEIFMQISKRFGLNPFSFNEESFYYLAISTSDEFPEINNIDELFHYSFDKEYLYRFKSNDKEKLESIKNQFTQSSVIRYSFDAPNSK